jgi:hypothetical protein
VRQQLGGREQLRQPAHAHGASAPQRSIEDRIVAHDRAGVRRRGLARQHGTPRLDDDHRLGSRRRAQPAHEASRAVDPLEVEQDCARLHVDGEVVQDLAKPDVSGCTERGDGREADLTGLGPVDDRAAQRARLGHERESTGATDAATEARVQADRRAHDPEAARPDQAHARASRARDGLLQQLAALAPRLRKPRRHDERELRAMLAALLHDVGDARGRHRDHGQIDALGQCADGWICLDAGHVGVPGVDCV